MYWCKSKTIYRAVFTGGILFAGLLPACKSDKETAVKKYFDLKGYFYADSARLTALNRAVLKTVIHNGIAETKKVHIENWGHELALFAQSDINKPAWKDSYRVESTANNMIYTAKYPELETRKIIINKANNKVKWILILNHTKNLLYETTERLTWFPDSLYRIQKLQHVKLMGSNSYDIKGVFN